MNLYHYRPIADEIYRVPILIVMATTNRGYILDMVPGQSFIEFLLEARLRRLHAGLDRAEAGRKKPADGGLRPRLHPGLRPPRAAGFRRARRQRDRLLLRRRAVAAVRLDLQRRADEEPDLLHHADRFPRDEAVLEFLRPALFRRRPARRQRRQRAAGNDPVVVRDAAAGVARGQPGAIVGEHLERRIRQSLPDVGSLGHRHACRWPASISAPSPRT